jgi:hypothetical protein
MVPMTKAMMSAVSIVFPPLLKAAL